MGFGLKLDTSADDLPPIFRCQGAVNLHGQAETVQELGAQVSFFGIHSAHQNELGRVAHRDTFPLHVVAAHGRGVQQDVYQVIVEEVDLVDIQDAPMRRRDQPGFEAFSAGLDSLLDVQGAH